MDQSLHIKDKLQQKLTAKEYQSLHLQLGITKTKLSRMLNNPQTEATTEIITKLSPILEINKVDLVLKYKLGYAVVNIQQLDQWRDESDQLTKELEAA